MAVYDVPGISSWWRLPTAFQAIIPIVQMALIWLGLLVHDPSKRLSIFQVHSGEPSIPSG